MRRQEIRASPSPPLYLRASTGPAWLDPRRNLQGTRAAYGHRKRYGSPSTKDVRLPPSVACQATCSDGVIAGFGAMNVAALRCEPNSRLNAGGEPPRAPATRVGSGNLARISHTYKRAPASEGC